ncbi:MAG TPA: LCP family protein [Acidimicrobiales bacterium]|nr:LCP family protein [Acidimicrobiales bacterium]
MASRKTKPRRSWPQRLIIGFNVCVIVVALSTAAVFGYVNTKLSDVQRLALSGALTESDPTPGAPENFLIVGTDSDLGLAADDPALQGRGDVTGARGDTIMILHVDPKAHHAALLSLPRDLWVEIAGQGIHSKINSALGVGGGGIAGPTTLISTIENNFDIPIHHYVEIDFAGFENLIEAIDGVPIYFQTGVRDYDPADGLAHTAIDIPGPGCYTLDPQQALAYARSRHMQYQEVPGDPSTWTSDNGNDLGRIQRQQDFVRRVLQRAVTKGIRDPLVMNDLVDAGVKSVRMDENLSAGAIIDLGRTFRNFDPQDLETTQLPVYPQTINGAAALKLTMPEAEKVLAQFQTGAADVDPQLRGVSVTVHNGTARENEATNVTRALQKVGFSTGRPSDELGLTDEASIIRYAPGQERQARLLARHLRSEVIFEPVSSSYSRTEESALVLVTGRSFTGVLTAPRPAADVPGPTTSAPTSTTTTTPDGGDEESSTGDDATTTTIPGFLPGPTPPGVDCG